MSEFDQVALERLGFNPADARRGRTGPPWQEARRDGPGARWLVAGLALLGLGALAWYSFGQDLVRYQKIRNM